MPIICVIRERNATAAEEIMQSVRKNNHVLSIQSFPVVTASASQLMGLKREPLLGLQPTISLELLGSVVIV